LTVVRATVDDSLMASPTLSRRIAAAWLAVLLVAACGGAVQESGTTPSATAPGSAATTAPGEPSSSSPSVAATAATPATPSAPPASAAVPSPTQEATMPDFVLTSTAFDAGGLIPRRYTCDGEDGSPELAWDGAPPNTKALVLLVDDPDARGWVHWIVLDMTGTSSGALPRGVGTSPDAPSQGRNDFGRIGWGGPCPPSGTHRYTFTLYALAAPLALPGTPGGDQVRKALDRAKVLDTAVLEGRYRRGG
jgi:Raf kinase inhibitor-like YbhB/YbcL family protein